MSPSIASFSLACTSSPERSATTTSRRRSGFCAKTWCATKVPMSSRRHLSKNSSANANSTTKTLMRTKPSRTAPALLRMFGRFTLLARAIRARRPYSPFAICANSVSRYRTISSPTILSSSGMHSSVRTMSTSQRTFIRHSCISSGSSAMRFWERTTTCKAAI